MKKHLGEMGHIERRRFPLTGKGDILKDVHGPGLAYEAYVPWDPSMTVFLKKHNIRRLVLNCTFGWAVTADGLRFLTELPELEMLDILDYRVNDISPIEDVSCLTELHLLTGPASKLDFSKLERLENCAIQSWTKGLLTIFHCSTLRRLYLYSVPIRSLEPLAALVRLERLEIKTSPLNTLDGIERLDSLRVAHFGRLTKLEDISSLRNLRSLEDLRLDTCRKIERLDVLESQAQLHRLSVDNCGAIESLRPIAHMDLLENFGFIESTNIVDGDLNVFLELPSLKKVWFKNRKHYTHTREEIRSILERRQMANRNGAQHRD